MRLLFTETLTFDEFMGDRFPPYAILSHTWDRQELNYHDMLNPTLAVKMKACYKKMMGFAIKSKELEYQHCWIDTCCIDKRSRVELTEAINSIFLWYSASSVCIVYIQDYQGPVFGRERLGLSRWFIRGLTLQELIAPRQLLFFNIDWSRITVDTDLLLDITGVPTRVLKDRRRLEQMSIAQKMCWASNRTTSRVENMAYYLMSLFDVNMTLLYGEGTKAFARLQEEIIRTSINQSIFLGAGKADDLMSWQGQCVLYTLFMW